MKNEAKNKILRYVIASYFIIQAIILIYIYGKNMFLSENIPADAVVEDAAPDIFPDYKDVTVPFNIAPMNFRINSPADKCYAKIGEKEYFGEQHIEFDSKDWHSLLADNKGKSLKVEVATKYNEKWTRWKAFDIHVSDKPIDSHLAYRLIEPGYEKWHIVGLYQRNLESFEEKAIIRNDMTGYNCINCHSFCNGNPAQMMFHMRAANGGTYIIDGNEITKLNTKTDKTISNMTYPYWHPSGKYITTSVNDIKQFFHSVKEKKMEVFDLESDIVIYDVEKKAILSEASIITKEHFETFPSFSPDGKWLYFCSADSTEMPKNYNKVRYNLCRVAFDAEKGKLNMPIDTLVKADSLSYTFPRISPDGKFLMYTETEYGQFPIWHKDAELRMLDLNNNSQIDISGLNSSDTESYHSWSSNSSWIVFSTRRDNGLYTLPYIGFIGEDGKPGKPFLLPQKNPDFYDYQLYSFNIPELITGEIEVSPYKIQQVATKEKPQNVKFSESGN